MFQVNSGDRPLNLSKSVESGTPKNLDASLFFIFFDRTARMALVIADWLYCFRLPMGCWKITVLSCEEDTRCINTET